MYVVLRLLHVNVQEFLTGPSYIDCRCTVQHRRRYLVNQGMQGRV
jgi:hypothetical protein